MKKGGQGRKMWILFGSFVVAVVVTRHLTTRHAHTRADLARSFHAWHHHASEKKTLSQPHQNLLKYALKQWKKACCTN